MKPKILITRKLPEKVIRYAKQYFQVEMWNSETKPIPRNILLEKVENKDGLLCLLTDNIDDEIFKCALNLKVIANLAVGFDNIEVNLAKKHNVIVTNTPGILTETTADLSFGLLIATARRMFEANTYIRENKWKTWSPFQLTGMDIYKANMGIIGMGRIARAFVKRAKGFNMNIKYFNRSRKLDVEEEDNISFSSFDEILETSDFICIFIPYSKDVHHLISATELKKMKKTSILINTARGGLIDEQALYNALLNGEISGAGLDVFEQEPISSDNPLLCLPNVVALPHIGSASEQTRLKMAYQSLDNLHSVLYNNNPINEVN